MDTWTECSRFICVCRCDSGDGSHTKTVSRTWFSQRAHWVSLLMLRSTRRRMFSLCDSESAFSAPLFSVSHIPPPPPPPPPPVVPFFATLRSLLLTMEGLNPGYLRRPDPSLIALSHDTVYRLHDSADTLPPAHLLASYLSTSSGKSTSWMSWCPFVGVRMFK